jgi:hypothetical protein
MKLLLWLALNCAIFSSVVETATEVDLTKSKMILTVEVSAKDEPWESFSKRPVEQVTLIPYHFFVTELVANSHYFFYHNTFNSIIYFDFSKPAKRANNCFRALFFRFKS